MVAFIENANYPGEWFYSTDLHHRMALEDMCKKEDAKWGQDICICGKRNHFLEESWQSESYPAGN